MTKLRFIIRIIVLTVLLPLGLSAQITLPDDFEPPQDEVYYIRLITAEEYSGVIREIIEDEKNGTVLKVKLIIGTAEIPIKQIAELRPLEKLYRHNHRIFLLPTADPIGDNYFLGNFELLMLYAGAGYDRFSVTAGRTVIPGISAAEQGTLFNMKATVYSEKNVSMAGGFTLALGANLAWLNNANRMLHFYGNGTFTMTRTRLTMAMFFKQGAEDFFTISGGRFGNFNVQYPNGAIGLALGFDTKFTAMNDVHFICELWNSDLAKPMNAGALLGLRIANTHVSADFGLSVWTAPAIAPFFSFVWTPQF